MSERTEAELNPATEAATETAVTKSTSPKPTPAAALFDFLEIVVFAVCATILLFALFFRVCRVDGDSMNNTLRNGETLVTSNLSEIEPGDIVIFHQTSNVYDRFNEALVKRVIATEGQTIRINYETAEVFVDGKKIDEPYAALMNRNGEHTGILSLSPSMPGYNRETRTFETTVPDGCYFVMGDNRNNSADSRSVEVGFVDARRILGKAVIRLNPWTVYN